MHPSSTPASRLPLAVLLVLALLGGIGAAGSPNPPAEAPRTAAPVRPFSWPSVLAPVLTATMTDAVIVGQGDGEANPGDRLRYTVMISNTGDMAATNVNLVFGAFVRTTFVAGSGRTTPLAIDDAYTTFGNTRVQVTSAAQGLLANDYDPDNGSATPGTGLTVKPGSVVRTGGTVTGTGSLTANADGTFTYLPPRGSLGTETFSYVLTDADNGDSPIPGVVTFTVGTAVVWYIDNAAGAGGDGRSSSPYNAIADYNTAQTAGGASNPEAGDVVFVATGSGAYTTGLTLLNTQRLIGQGVSLQTELGVAPGVGVTLPAAGTAPTLTSTGNTVTLAQNNTLRGLTLGNATGVDLTGTGFGTLTLTDVTLNGSGRPLALTNGTLSATFLLISSSAAPGGAGISLQQVAGTMAVTNGTTITGSGTQGILVGQSTANINFGNTSITGGTDAVSLQNNSAGTRTFGTFSTNNNSGVGFLHAAGGGTTTVTGAASILNSGGAGIDIRSSTTAVTFGSTTVASSAGTGVSLGTAAAGTGNSAAVTFGDLDISADAGQRVFHALNNTGTITTTSGTWTGTGGASTVEIAGASAGSRTPLALALDAVSSTDAMAAGVSYNFVSGAVSFAGAVSITNPMGAGLQVQNSSATFAFNGAFTSTGSGGTGVLLNTNTGTIGFNSASTFQVTPDAAATALSIQASTAAVSSTTGTLTTTSAPALDAANSVLNLTLATVTASNTGDPDPGINLNTASGTLTVNGGTITGGTGTAVNVNAGTVNATIRANVTQNAAARVVAVQNSTGGTIAFNTGTITGGAASTGVLVSGLAAGSSVTFANLNLGAVGSPMANTAVTLQSNAGNVGLGVVNIYTTGSGSGIVSSGTSTGSISSTSGVVSAGAAAAVSITGPAGLTPLDMALTTVSANGGANGIVLQNTGTTGSPGGFRVLGTGTAGSGGTIAGITGADGATAGNGVYLNNTRRVSLTRMNFTGSQNNGIFGTGVRGVLAMDNLVFSGLHGTSNSGDFDESVVNLVDAGGAITLKNSTLNGGAFNAARVENLTTSPTLDSLVFANNTVTTMQGSAVDVRSTALLVGLYGGSADVRVRQNTVSYWWGNAIHVLFQQTASGTARITGNTAHQTNTGALAGAGGIWVAGGNLTYRIANNSVRGTNGSAISADRTAAGTLMQGVIENNQVGASGIPNSGSGTGIGIFASHHGPQTTTVRIANNIIRQINGSANGAITTVSGDNVAYGGSGTLNATITGNNIQESGTTVNNAQHGILITHGTVGISPSPPDTDVGCYDILNNTIVNFNTGSAANNHNRIRVNQRFSTTSRYPGYTGANAGVPSQTDLATYFLSRNTASNSTNANTSTGGFLNTSPAGSACPQPAPLSFTAQADVPAEPTNPVLDEAPTLLGSVVAPAPVEVSKVEEAPATGAFASADVAPVADVVRAAAYSPAPPVGGPRVAADPVLLASADRLESVRLAVEAFEARRAAEEAAAPAAARDPEAVTPVYAYTSEGDTIVAYVNAFGGITFPIGTLPAGRSVTVTFDVDIDDPFGAGTASVSSQGTVTADGGISVSTDDPDVAGAANATVTPVVDRRSVPTSLAGTAPEGADAGWRYLSAPVTGVTLATMAAQNLVQGVPGYYDGPIDCNGVPCLSNFRTGWDGTTWPVPSGGAQQLLPGRGFIWYLYDLTFNPGGPSQSVALPTTLSATGVVAAGPVAVPLHTVGADPGKWNLVGNPYPNPLNVSDVESWAQGGTINSAVLQTWDPVPGSYVLSTTQGDVVQVWQAAFLENSTATTLSIPASAQTTGALLPTGTPTPDGATAGTTPVETGLTASAEADEEVRSAPEPVQLRLVAFELAGTDAMTNAPTRDRAAVVAFRSDAVDGADLWDAGKLSPSMAAYALLAFGAERPGPDGPEAVLRAQESRPFEPTATVELPVHVLARGTSPTLTLTWPTLENVPEGWALVLRDLETGQDVNLREQQSYTFAVTPSARGEARPDEIRSARAEGNARFTLIVAPSGVVAAGDGPLPRVFALTGIYPNPSRGAATVAFDVPRAAEVTVEVFDVLGRRVATLAEGSQAPGRHTLRLDGGLLSTGTYLVRMRASSEDSAETYERARAVTIIR